MDIEGSNGVKGKKARHHSLIKIKCLSASALHMQANICPFFFLRFLGRERQYLGAVNWPLPKSSSQWVISSDLTEEEPVLLNTGMKGMDEPEFVDDVLMFCLGGASRNARSACVFVTRPASLPMRCLKERRTPCTDKAAAIDGHQAHPRLGQLGSTLLIVTISHGSGVTTWRVLETVV